MKRHSLAAIRVISVLVGICLLVVAPAAAVAQAYPGKPIQWVIPLCPAAAWTC